MRSDVKRPARRDLRGGQVIVAFAALLLPLLLALVAFAVDVGLMVVTKTRLQNGADAACLAASGVLLEQQALAMLDPGDMTEEEWEAQARLLATAAAVEVQRDNVAGSGALVEFGSLQGDVFALQDTSTPATAVRVRATLNGDAPAGALSLPFAGVIGAGECDVAASAAAQVASSIVGVLRGLSPFAIPRDNVPAIGASMVFFPYVDAEDAEDEEEGHGDDQVTPGNWGLLDLDGGGNSAADISDWIENGYDEVFIIDPDSGLWIEGTPGIKTSMKSALESRIGDQLIMVVYDQVEGQGAGTQYHCVGFLVATLTEVRLTGKPSQQRLVARVDELSNLSDVIGGTGPPNSPNIRKLQLVQ